MVKESELDFLNRRAGEELDRADASRDASIAHIHRQLAMAYAERITKLRAETATIVEIRPRMASLRR